MSAFVRETSIPCFIRSETSSRRRLWIFAGNQINIFVFSSLRVVSKNSR